MKTFLDDFEKIYGENYQSVYSFLHILTQSKDTANHLAQKTFVSTCKNILRYKGICSIRTWLLAAAGKQFMNFLKTENRIMDFSLLVTNPDTPIFENTGCQWTGKVNSAELGNYLNSLPKRDSLILLLRIFGDVDYSELANLFGISAKSAEAIFIRTKEKTKEVLFND